MVKQKTIPYFVDVEKRCNDLPPEERSLLGLLQTPQCFYNPDVFQHFAPGKRAGADFGQALRQFGRLQASAPGAHTFPDLGHALREPDFSQ